MSKILLRAAIATLTLAVTITVGATSAPAVVPSAANSTVTETESADPIWGAGITGAEKDPIWG
ncbi:hypothetical protein ABT063_06530 [Streptomyces sp. NPDC002838]|uniref:hypothetical protein n=1 Tax=Streptomyces sp. NPDC002838 TaxID=3154436 RepID=UPI0033194D5E